MARQQYQTTPYVKHLEVFNDFSRGLNTVTTNDKLSVSELPVLTNMDLGDRGSLKRRAGMKTHLASRGSIKWSAIGTMKWSELT